MKWLKYGCGGCLAVLLLVGLAVGILVGVSSIGMRSTQISETTHEPDLPPTALPPVHDGLVPRAAEGRLVLDLRHAEFIVQTGEAGSPPRVEASYDPKGFELVESLDSAAPGAGEAAWVYRVSFRRTSGWAVSTIRQLLGAKSPRVRVLVPPDRPIALELHVDSGGAEVELGGSWITEARFELERGGFQLSFDSPLRQPMERLVVHGSMGGFEAKGIGNASPREVEVDFSMGGAELDLTGQWQRDSVIALRVRRAGAEVHLPRDLRIEGVPGRPVALSSPGEIPLPTLRFTVDERNAEIEFN